MKCWRVFSETKGTFVENLQRPIGFIVDVLNARSEGLGFNATCRMFGIGRDTLIRWESKFKGLRELLFLYALSCSFVKQEVEGDEFYTKVAKNVPVEDCEGWTVVLMERASRFIWEIKCGRKDRALFMDTLQTLVSVIDKTEDLTLLTDGERRYGNILFDICHQLTTVGKRNKRSKVLPKGVKVRLKNKGDKNRENGSSSRPKYESPHQEHPETIQDISESDIHANHVEAFNSSTRRRNSTCRRRTNTYAKTKEGLQRTLDLLWVLHNFVRPHYMTKVVPAVALGIIKKALSWNDLFGIQVFVSA
jgi:hypothetical protein